MEIKLHSRDLVLRSLEPDDLPYFMRVENDPQLWSVCDTRIPFSRFTLERVLEARVPDFFADRQLRLVVCLREGGESVGFVDLFDFSPLHRRAGIGVVIYPADHRGKGYADQAMELALGYAFSAFNLHQVWAEVPCSNEPSKALFDRLGFTLSGIFHQWLLCAGQYTDVNVYQLTAEDFLSRREPTQP